jgi:hypothetical protein
MAGRIYITQGISGLTQTPMPTPGALVTVIKIKNPPTIPRMDRIVLVSFSLRNHNPIAAIATMMAKAIWAWAVNRHLMGMVPLGNSIANPWD